MGGSRGNAMTSNQPQEVRRHRRPGFPAALATVWALVLLATAAWSLFPEQRSASEGWSLFSAREYGSPTRTFELLVKVALFFFVAVWPMFLLRRGAWMPRGKPAAAVAARRGTARPSGTMSALPVPDEPGASEEAVAAEAVEEATQPSLPARVVPKVEADEIEMVPEEPGDSTAAGVNVAATAPGPVARGRTREPDREPATPSMKVAIPPVIEVPQTPQPTSGEMAPLAQGARVANPAATVPEPINPVGARYAVMQLLVLTFVAAPFFVASLWLSDVSLRRLGEAGILLGSYALLHIGYAAATDGRLLRAPDRLYVAALMMLTLGLGWVSDWWEQFNMNAPWRQKLRDALPPSVLADRVLVEGIAWPTAIDGSLLRDPFFVAMFWPAALGLALLVISPLTARREA